MIVLILDMNMPTMSGLEVLKQIQDFDIVKIIFSEVEVPPEMRKEIEELGGTFISKDNRSELLEYINSLKKE